MRLEACLCCAKCCRSRSSSSAAIPSAAGRPARIMMLSNTGQNGGSRPESSAGGSRIRTLGPSPRARMSSVVAFMRAKRGPRACKFPVRRRFRAGANAVWAACGVTSHRSHAGRFLSFANATCALALGEQLLGLPAIEFIGALAFHLEIEHFRGSAPGVDLVRRSSRRQRYCRIPPDKSAVFCRRPTSSPAPPLSASMERISDR